MDMVLDGDPAPAVPQLMQGPKEWFLAAPGRVTGRPLRYLLTTFLLEAGSELSVRELAAMCERQGVVFDGRASKVISDALRWEIGWGRVRRVRRGVYAGCGADIARSTRRWIASRAAQLRVYFWALRRATHQRHATAGAAVLGAPATFTPLRT